MMSSLLQVRDLSKRYRQREMDVHVLDRLSFALEGGTWTTILGPSGCGKTTLLKILVGLERADSGTVLVDGAQVPQLGSIAYLPQHDTLLPWRDALGNAILASEIDRRSLKEAKREAIELFEHFGLGGFEFDGLWLLVLTGVRVQDSGLKLKPQRPQPQKRQATHL